MLILLTPRKVAFLRPRSKHFEDFSRFQMGRGLQIHALPR